MGAVRKRYSLLAVLLAGALCASCVNGTKNGTEENATPVADTGLALGLPLKSLASSPWFEDSYQANDSTLVSYTAERIKKFSEDLNLVTQLSYVAAVGGADGTVKKVFFGGQSVEEGQAEFVLKDCIRLHEWIQRDSLLAGGQPYVPHTAVLEQKPGTTIALFSWSTDDEKITLVTEKRQDNALSWQVLFQMNIFNP